MKVMLSSSLKSIQVFRPHGCTLCIEKEKLYLVMELKPGRQLSELWPGLSDDDKSSISGQLHTIWDKIRSIPSPSTSFSNVTGGPPRHRWFQWLEPDPRIEGPFEKEEDLNVALALRSQKDWEGNGRIGWISEFFARNLSRTLKNHPSVLTHGDLQRKNILVQELPEAGDRPRQLQVSAVLDWEDAGWYPSYWEYAACFVDFRWVDDWPEHVERIIEPYISESAVLRLVRQDLDF